MKNHIKKTMQMLLKIFQSGFGYFKEHYIRIGFYFFACLLVVNALFMTLFFLNRDYDYILVDELYIEAVLPGQDINDTLYTGIAKIEAIDYDGIDIGDRVVMCCAYGIDENWVMDVMSVDREENRLTVSYDGVVTTDVGEDGVRGVFVGEANVIGTYYYTTMFTRGYILLMSSQVFFIFLYYYVLVRENVERKELEPGETESDDDDEMA